MRVLVAGASGTLGRLVVAALEDRGHCVRAVVRRIGSLPPARAREIVAVDARNAAAWNGLCRDVEVVFSSLGASVSPSMLVRGPTYTRLDAPANVALLAEARRSGVRRFVYTSLIGGDASRHTDYAEGHERVVDALRTGGVEAVVLRPTGFFCAMTALVEMARRGVVPVFGDGSSRTNPVSEIDLAEVAVRAIESSHQGLTELPAGGPEVFTRKRIAEMAFEALGRRPRLVHVPVSIANAVAACAVPFNLRGAHFARFAAHVMTHDCLARPIGTRTLAACFAAYAASGVARG